MVRNARRSEHIPRSMCQSRRPAWIATRGVQGMRSADHPAWGNSSMDWNLLWALVVIIAAVVVLFFRGLTP